MVNSSLVVHAVVVTFNPQKDVLSAELLELSLQVHRIWVIDNASVDPVSDWIGRLGLSAKLELLELAENMGVGFAQNTGIRHARSAGATHVLILDQDSQPSPGMVNSLLIQCQRLEATGVQVAAVAPVYADSHEGAASDFLRLSKYGFVRKSHLSTSDVEEADFLISSGCLMSVNVFDRIGFMDEKLFIDHVDTEWCIRAQSKGYCLFGVPAARMTHTLGEKRTRIWFLRWRNVPYHAPFRYYYILRNSLLMQRRPYMPLKWRVAEALRCLRVLVFYGLFAPRRGECLRMMFKGLWHGVRGISGPLRS